MGVGGVTAMGCTVGQGCRGCRRWRWAASSRWRHRGRRRAGIRYQVWRLERTLGVMTTEGPTRALGDADLERRFGGLRRLYGDAGYARLRAARFAVVGWAAWAPGPPRRWPAAAWPSLC
jgi:hypothetical protein